MKLKIGSSYQFDFQIDQKLFNNFFEITKDNNFVHYENFTLNDKEVNPPILFGMLIASKYSTLIGNFLPGPGSIIMDSNIKFHRPAYLNTHYTIYGEVTNISIGLKIFKIKSNIKFKDKLISSASFNVMISKKT